MNTLYSLPFVIACHMRRVRPGKDWATSMAVDLAIKPLALRRFFLARGHVTLNLRPHHSSAPSSIHMEGVDTFHLLPLCERTSLVYDVFALGWCDIVGSLSMRALTMQSARAYTHLTSLMGYWIQCAKFTCLGISCARQEPLLGRRFQR